MEVLYLAELKRHKNYPNKYTISVKFPSMADIWIKKKLPIKETFRLHGNVLPSQGAIPQLLSALRSLTSVFDMGTGVSFSLSPPHFSDPPSWLV